MNMHLVCPHTYFFFLLLFCVFISILFACLSYFFFNFSYSANSFFSCCNIVSIFSYVTINGTVSLFLIAGATICEQSRCSCQESSTLKRSCHFACILCRYYLPSYYYAHQYQCYYFYLLVQDYVFIYVNYINYYTQLLPHFLVQIH